MNTGWDPVRLQPAQMQAVSLLRCDPIAARPGALLGTPSPPAASHRALRTSGTRVHTGSGTRRVCGMRTLIGTTTPVV